MLYRGSRPDHSSWFYNLCTQLKPCSFIWRHKLKAGITGMHLKTKWSLKNPGSALTMQNNIWLKVFSILSTAYLDHRHPQKCSFPRSEGKGNDGFFKDGKEEQGCLQELSFGNREWGVGSVVWSLLCDGFPVGSCRVPVQQVPAAILNTQTRPVEIDQEASGSTSRTPLLQELLEGGVCWQRDSQVGKGMEKLRRSNLLLSPGLCLFALPF